MAPMAPQIKSTTPRGAYHELTLGLTEAERTEAEREQLKRLAELDLSAVCVRAPDEGWRAAYHRQARERRGALALDGLRRCRFLTAAHEAGHVVVYAAEGLAVYNAAVLERVMPRSRAHGWVVGPTPLVEPWCTPADLLRAARLLLGGWAGEAFVLDHPDLAADLNPDEMFDAAALVALAAYRECRGSFWRCFQLDIAGWDAVRGSVLSSLERWHDVWEAVTAALEAERKLSRKRLEGLLTPIRAEVPMLDQGELRRAFLP